MTTAMAAADINDVYAWVPSTGKVALAMTVSPFADGTAVFSDQVQYTFHLNSAASFGMPATAVTIICQFAPNQRISCWAGDDLYVEGDASAEAGLSTAGGEMKVFAGPRDDPFFFNLNGFQNAVATVASVAGTLVFDANGCPAVDAATSMVLRTQLSTEPDGTPAVDDFAGANILAIVIEIDTTKAAPGGPIMGVWASTNTRQ